MRRVRTLVAAALALSVFLASETSVCWTSGGESASRPGLFARNIRGEPLGRIRDLVAGGEGRIEYVIVSYGGGLFGMGGKLISIPWKSVKVVGTDE